MRTKDCIGSVVLFAVCASPLWALSQADFRALDETAKRPLSGVQTVVIDPGHGGKDNGATGPSQLKEKDVALQLALRLRRVLSDQGFHVLMTREDDRYVSLQERARHVHSRSADLFISIHGNAARNPTARGYETFYLSDPGNDAYDPDKMPEDGYTRYEQLLAADKELAKVYLGLLDKASSDDRAISIDLAERIHDSIRARLRWRDRGVKRAGFFVLKKTEIPAVLLEIGFLSNPKDERLLKSPRYLETIAKAIAGGVAAFRDERNTAVCATGP